MKHKTMSDTISLRIRSIGKNLRLARTRRRKNLQEAAEMIGISVSSLRRMEAGDPSVKFGSYITALEVFQLMDSLRFAEPGDDIIGMALEKQRMPERIRREQDTKLDF